MSAHPELDRELREHFVRERKGLITQLRRHSILCMQVARRNPTHENARQAVVAEQAYLTLALERRPPEPPAEAEEQDE